ncbi:salicylate hydroxylase [Amaricoccus macauensis]|uniref:Salicylate hydroxylase n=1 Tax=Amaricoccus macauensis TaxID=57001 RepID=A0A840SKT0_9RHOB|nr:FAD-dependent monooxygenase [Amaricoccus macauensis]MBB5222547.1 salicylate hydroxylase [Amaricoccus macauensis]
MALAGRGIAVVGGGVGGVAAALALARRGAAVTLWERAAELGEVGAGLQIGPNGVAVLEALGVTERLRERASLPEAIELRDHVGGRLVARVPLGATARARYGRPYWHLHRADLLAGLVDAAMAAGVSVRLGHEVTGPDDPLLAGAEVVIGADGVRSRLRAATGTGGAVRFTGHVAWRGIVPADRVPGELARPASRVWMAPGRHLVSYPLRGGRLVNFIAIEERTAWAEEGWSLPGDPDEVRRAFADFGGDAGALLGVVSECFLWGLFDHPALTTWRAGRLALLGDACHPMLPFLAQGATMALEDAWVLAETLDRAPDPAAGLAEYERLRRARVTRVQRASARNAGVYHLSGVGRRPVHAGLRAISTVAPGLLLGRFDWLYGSDVTRTG